MRKIGKLPVYSQRLSTKIPRTSTGVIQEKRQPLKRLPFSITPETNIINRRVTVRKMTGNNAVDEQIKLPLASACAVF